MCYKGRGIAVSSADHSEKSTQDVQFFNHPNQFYEVTNFQAGLRGIRSRMERKPTGNGVGRRRVLKKGWRVA